MAEEQKPASEEQQENPYTKQMGEGYLLAPNLVVSTLIGMGVGLLLDKWLGTMPLFLLLFLLLGFGAGLRRMIQSAMAEMKK